MALPSPRAAPVTSAFLPSRRKSGTGIPLAAEGVVGPGQGGAPVLRGTDVAGACVSFKPFHPGGASAELAEEGARFGVRHFLVSDGAQVLADPKATGVAGGATGGQHVVGSNDLVPVGDAGSFAEEQCTVVVHLLQRLAGVLGEDLDVFVGILVCQGVRVVEGFNHVDGTPVPPGGTCVVAGGHVHKDRIDVLDDLPAELF